MSRDERAAVKSCARREAARQCESGAVEENLSGRASDGHAEKKVIRARYCDVFPLDLTLSGGARPMTNATSVRRRVQRARPRCSAARTGGERARRNNADEKASTRERKRAPWAVSSASTARFSVLLPFVRTYIHIYTPVHTFSAS